MNVNRIGNWLTGKSYLSFVLFCLTYKNILFPDHSKNNTLIPILYFQSYWRKMKETFRYLGKRENLHFIFLIHWWVYCVQIIVTFSSENFYLNYDILRNYAVKEYFCEKGLRLWYKYFMSLFISIEVIRIGILVFKEKTERSR